jgi:hypothetical protein
MYVMPLVLHGLAAAAPVHAVNIAMCVTFAIAKFFTSSAARQPFGSDVASWVHDFVFGVGTLHDVLKGAFAPFLVGALIGAFPATFLADFLGYFAAVAARDECVVTTRFGWELSWRAG